MIEMTMKVRIEYEYGDVQSDKILQLVMDFEKKLTALDKNCVCRNFQISALGEYERK